jgi:alditol oxidase
MSEPITNWAGNLAFRARAFAAPTSEAELRDILRSGERVKALGTGHSFNAIADTDGVLVSTVRLGGEPELDAARGIVRVRAGMRYGELAAWLEARGWALGNLASLPHISVGGAVSTGTHGSGDRNPSLAAAVTAVELVTADGESRRYAEGHADFGGVVVSLGALGVMTTLELRIEPTYAVAQTVFEDVPWTGVLTDLTAVTSAAYSVSLFTTLRRPDVVDQIWTKDRLDRPGPGLPVSARAHPATAKRHPLPAVDAEPCTEQGGAPGPWLQRLPHFRLEFTPSNGDELQSEFLLPRAAAPEAIDAVRGMADRIAPLLQVCEVRTVAADTPWLSLAGGRDAVGIHFTWRPLPREVAALLPVLHDALGGLGARPHWGKLFDVPRTAAALPRLYPEWERFVRLRDELDPRRVLANDLLDALGA